MISFGCVDSDAKIFLILSPPLENSTTHNAIIVSVVGHCILKSRWRRSLMKAKEAKQHVSTRCPSVLSQREKIYLLAVTQSFYHVKFRFSEKNTKFEKKSPICFNSTEKNSCFVKTSGRFFQILRHSHNVLTLPFWFQKKGSNAYFSRTYAKGGWWVF